MTPTPHLDRFATHLLIGGAVILALACEGPKEPTGDEREVVWLYPADVVYQDSVDHGILRFKAIYFDISIDEYYERRGDYISIYVSSIQDQDTIKYWAIAYTRTVDDSISRYYKKLGARLYYWYEWHYAYFYWDAEP